LIIYHKIILFYFYFPASIIDNDKDIVKQIHSSLHKPGVQTKIGNDSEKAFIGEDELAEVKEVQQFSYNLFS